MAAAMLAPEHGFQGVPLSAKAFLEQHAKEYAQPPALRVEDIPIPQSDLAKAVQEYAQKQLPKETFHHSMRVFLYGEAIRRNGIPILEPISSETHLMACMLHDIGTAPSNMSNTYMSFEFQGGMIAHKLLADELKAPAVQADAVAEAVIRHQDLGEKGSITALGQLVQLTTVLDNIGDHADLVHADTIANIAAAWPRINWSSCFAATIRKECSLKPWAHTTVIGGPDGEEFAQGVEGNKVTGKYP